jgi:2-polyprenyl-3-methyl-5-hydroxy-6-metoxy-1,4-benzoquinol methylase
MQIFKRKFQPRKIRISRLIGKIIPSFNDPPHIGELIRFLHFRDEIKKIEFHDVLDAGCGWGKYSFFLSKSNPQAKIIGVDISDLNIRKNKIEAQRRNMKNIEFIKKDLLDLDYDNKFDLIVCVDVLEHIKDDEKLIKILYRALKHGGCIFIRTPRTKEFRFFSRFRDYLTEGHVRRGYEPEELDSMLEKQGFTLKKIRRTSGVFGALAWELDMIVRGNVYIYHLMYPLFYMLSLLDAKIVGKKRFNGFYILAEKIPSI